ncbi:MAG: hypothetical protein R6U32_00905 [Candidatus Woesearchaeota archaeon]
MAEFRRKLYKRGSSYETTLPMPILFALDLSKKHNVIFRYDAEKRRWYLDFEEAGHPGRKGKNEENNRGGVRK